MSRTSLLQPSTLGFVAKQDMPHHLSILFRARPPLEYAPPIEKGKCKPLAGYFDGQREYFTIFEEAEPPKQQPIEKSGEKKERIKKEKLVKHLADQKQEIKQWNPYQDPTIKGDPYRTLFVSRLSYKTDEKTLKKEFEVYGPIRRIRIVVDQKTGKPRGYAFIEYDNERDFKLALEKGNGRRVDGARVVVDYERGRTRQEWVPRRLGGGKGDKRRDRDTERAIRDLKKSHPLLRSRSRSQDKNKQQTSETATNNQPSQQQSSSVQLQPPSTQQQQPNNEEKKDDNKKSHHEVKRSRSRSRDNRRESDTSNKRGDSDRNDRRDKKDKDKKKKDKKDKKDKDKKKKDKKDKKHKKRRSEETSATKVKETANNNGNDQVKRDNDEEAEPGEIQ